MNTYSTPHPDHTSASSSLATVPRDYRVPRLSTEPALPVREIAIVAASAVAGILIGVLVKRGGRP